MSDTKREHLPLRVEQRLEAQIIMADRLRTRGTATPTAAPFITIMRQYGCEAMSLAEELAAQMPGGPWPVYNRQLFEKLAEEEHVSHRLFNALDVHVRSGIEEFFENLLGHSPSDLRLLHHLVHAMRAVATLGHCVIVGRGAPVLTAGLTGGIHVRLIAPCDWRERNLIQRFGWSKGQADEVLREEKHGRHNFFRKYLNQDANNPELYDLMLNVAHLSRPEQLALIMALYRARFGS